MLSVKIRVERLKKVLKANDFIEYRNLMGKLSNVEVRKWYNYHDKNIINKIDKSLSIKQQAIQAHYLRNKYRTEARKLMRDRKLAKHLDINNHNLPFEYYENKYLKQGYSNDSLYEKILDASTRSNKMVNKKLGIV
ncbi:Rhs family protein [Clostridium tetanomorphum DSM 665]|uniref:hypothetical protein n=1 Tax=Clostridium tetanomorphum TaxID=1553 RepID=UPI00045047A6|nr:hypothetical protein [Clostridium tetanomorphum]KAJ53013.1 Rhs family protein [Clostridium tetanomorphum DSM 665]NRZ98737.1 hypothetical protein [Clostridium tetanomorphum]